MFFQRVRRVSIDTDICYHEVLLDAPQMIIRELVRGERFKTIRHTGDTSTVHIDYETIFAPDNDSCFAAIKRYYDVGLKLFLRWHLNDCDCVPDPILGGRWGTGPLSFGELYTEVILNAEGKGSCFGPGQGLHSLVAVDRNADEHHTIKREWFERRGIDPGDVSLEMGRALVQEAYPDHILAIVSEPRDDEVLTDVGVINRKEVFNELIAKTLGEEWFQRHGIAKGEPTVLI